MSFAGKAIIEVMVAGASGVPVEIVAKVLDAWDKVVLTQLDQGNQVRLLGCGILRVKMRAPTKRKLPGGEIFTVPPKRVITFHPTTPLDGKVTPETGPKPRRGRPPKVQASGG